MRRDSISATGIDVVHVTSLLRIAIVVVVITFISMQLCCQQNYCNEYITYTSLGEGPNSYIWLQRKAVWLICVKLILFNK